MGDLRTTAQRKADVLSMLAQHRDGWLATATEKGGPHLVVVATVWTDGALVIATRRPSRTARNLEQARRGRLALGTPEDVVMIDLEVERAVSVADGGPIAEAFRAAVGWDPADEGADWCYFVLRPTRVQAYRGYGEVAGREVMRDGHWLV
jgi:hypothetical protein